MKCEIYVCMYVCYPFLAQSKSGLFLSDDRYTYKPINIFLKKKKSSSLLQEGYTVLSLCLAMVKGIHITDTQTDGRDFWSTLLRWAQFP
jgi:hypothetical protein